MDIEPKNLFTKGKSSNIGKLYGKWKVKRQGILIPVEIYQQALVEAGSSDSTSRTIEFDFDLKYSFIRDALEIKFERGKDSCAYNMLSEADM